LWGRHSAYCAYCNFHASVCDIFVIRDCVYSRFEPPKTCLFRVTVGCKGWLFLSLFLDISTCACLTCMTGRSAERKGCLVLSFPPTAVSIADAAAYRGVEGWWERDESLIWDGRKSKG
ncbi:hypothetical protein CORC01_14352, partial [Colletotrichum orchidophilum]